MLKLTAEFCKQRRERLIETSGADFLIINNPRHILYLSGLHITQLALSGWGANFLTIDAVTGHSTLIIHNMVSGDGAHVDQVESWRWYDAGAESGNDPYWYAIDEVKQRLPSLTGKRVGAELGWLPVGLGIERSDQMIDLTPHFLEMRRRKDPDELLLIREAIRAVGAGHRAAREAIKPGLTELDMYNVIHAAIVKEAGAAIHLMGDYASGDRANGGGGMATPRVLQAGELMICDIFPIVNGYRADYTATLSVDGTLSDVQRRLETALHQAMVAGEAMLKPGSRAADVHKAVKGALAEHGFAEGFGHHAGHGLGLGHPEAPYFVPNSQEVIVAGDVVTLEPGSYKMGGYGARIENNYLITESSFERLSQHDTHFTTSVDGQ